MPESVQEKGEPDMRKNLTERISLLVTEDMREVLELQSKIRGVPVSLLVREALYSNFFDR